MRAGLRKWVGTGLMTTVLGVLSSCLLTSSFAGLTSGGAPPDAGPDSSSDASSATTAGSGGRGGDGATSSTSGGNGGGGRGGSVSSSASSSGDGGSSSSASGGGAGGAPAPCPGNVGPVPVRIPDLGYCIDSTEVTNAQYAQFLSAMPSVTRLPPVCAAKTSFVPALLPATCGSTPGAEGAPDAPVIGVDWCDAYAFCAWNGKRLCGKIGGGALAPAEAANHLASEWTAACSAQGTRTYPYASATYVPLACSAHDDDSMSVLVTGSLPGCEGGYPGIFDMSGNASEWEDACDESGSDPTQHPCPVRGGDLCEVPAHLVCVYVEPHPRFDRTYYIGFRCCGG